MDEQLLGEIRLFPFGYTPQGWLRCDGTLYNVTDYQFLYALIGNIYGSRGVQGQTFVVPDLTGTEPDPLMRYCIAWNGFWPQRPY